MPKQKGIKVNCTIVYPSGEIVLGSYNVAPDLSPEGTGIEIGWAIAKTIKKQRKASGANPAS